MEKQKEIERIEKIEAILASLDGEKIAIANLSNQIKDEIQTWAIIKVIKFIFPSFGTLLFVIGYGYNQMVDLYETQDVHQEQIEEIHTEIKEIEENEIK